MGSLSRGRGLLLRQLHVIWAESLGIQLRRSRCYPRSQSRSRSHLTEVSRWKRCRRDLNSQLSNLSFRRRLTTSISVSTSISLRQRDSDGCTHYRCKRPVRKTHYHLSARWAALFWEESLLQRQSYVLGTESSGPICGASRWTSTLNSQISNLSFRRRLMPSISVSISISPPPRPFSSDFL